MSSHCFCTVEVTGNYSDFVVVIVLVLRYQIDEFGTANTISLCDENNSRVA